MLSAMLAAGPALPAAIAAMHATVPQSALFKTQARALPDALARLSRSRFVGLFDLW